MNKLALIVEDSPDTAEIFDAALTTAGYTTEIINDGQIAINRLDEIEPYLILLDLHLPNVPGDKILDYIIKQDHLKNVRVIIASADGQLADFQGHKNKDQLMIMQKPVSFDQLTLISKRLLQA